MNITEKTFISIDIETTGLGSNSKIIEIGAVKFRPFGLTQAIFDELIHPGIEIPENVIQIHGITDEMVVNSPEIEHVLPLFFEFIEDYPLFAHNSGFDFTFLVRYADEYGFEFKGNDIFDTLALSRKAFPGIKHNLNFLTKFFGLIPDGRRHRGVADAKLAARVFELCLDKLSINLYEELEKIYPPKKPANFLKKK